MHRILLLFSIWRCASILEQEGILFGAWLDYKPGVDSPKEFNQRLGKNAAFFQFSQVIPLDYNNPPPVDLIEETGTNAFIYLTVYPNSGFNAVTPAAINAFVKQLGGWTKKGKRVLVRYAPEMNGSWFAFGQQPIEFKQTWKNIVTAVRNGQFTRGMVEFIWGPNTGAGYPFTGGAFSAADVNSLNFKELDTNSDGVIDKKDDPYGNYYPGDEFVDWIGLSTYYFGREYPFVANNLPPSDEFDKLIRGASELDNVVTIDFYETYVRNSKKPFMITESGTAFHEFFLANSSAILDPGPGELAMKQGFWRQYITNRDTPRLYPNLKGICIFEFDKEEELTHRDFHITQQPEVLAAFKADLDQLPPGQLVFAKSSAGTEKTTFGSLFSFLMEILIF